MVLLLGKGLIVSHRHRTTTARSQQTHFHRYQRLASVQNSSEIGLPVSSMLVGRPAWFVYCKSSGMPRNWKSVARRSFGETGLESGTSPLAVDLLVQVKLVCQRFRAVREECIKLFLAFLRLGFVDDCCQTRCVVLLGHLLAFRIHDATQKVLEIALKCVSIGFSFPRFLSANYRLSRCTGERTKILTWPSSWVWTVGGEAPRDHCKPLAESLTRHRPTRNPLDCPHTARTAHALFPGLPRPYR